VSRDVTAEVGRPTAVVAHGQGLAVAASGSAWVSGADGVVEHRPDGTTTPYRADAGVPTTTSDPPVVAAPGRDVLLRTRDGAWRLEGDRFAPVWSDPAWSTWTHSSAQLVAASGQEAWSLAYRPGEVVQMPDSLGDPWTGPPLGWTRFHDGTWTAVGPAVLWYGRPAALATDGALWALTSAGLVRFLGEQWQAVAADLVEGPDDGMFWNDPRVVAGPDSSVWTSTTDGRIVQVRPDGTRTDIGRPPGVDAAVPRAGGADGSVWVLVSDPSGAPELAVWTGRWSTVAVPEDVDEVEDLVVADDGSLWAALLRPADSGGDALGRYADGTWTVFPEPSAHSLADAPGAVVCAGQPVAGPIRCYDPDGLVGEVPFDASYEGFDIAPDGAVWVRAEQVVRLGPEAPRR
jgi:hypothetical protein